MTLSNYPANLRVGFPIPRWQELCREIDAQDDEPFDRDERRAWYDTLRDLVPASYGFKPTVRIYAGDFPWCQFDADSEAALGKMQARIIRGGMPIEAQPVERPRRLCPLRSYHRLTETFNQARWFPGRMIV